MDVPFVLHCWPGAEISFTTCPLQSWNFAIETKPAAATRLTLDCLSWFTLRCDELCTAWCIAGHFEYLECPATAEYSKQQELGLP
ncbi:hypothetical protein GJ496_004417 [Pomphorhynchus laevis]|nr:hypothetical protein GJ496_004417 [Pomphorhynchus laevis]